MLTHKTCKMKFEVLKRLKSCRSGAIRVGNQSIQTPSCFLYTRGGAIPHIILDVLRSIHNLPSVVHLTLSSLTDQPGVEIVNSSCYNGVMEFLGLEDFISYLSIQDPLQQTREGYNEEKTVSVWTPSGRKKIDVNQFIKVLQAFKPTIAECLCDTIPASQQTEKRIRKSVDRSLKFLDECITVKETKKELASCNLFGVVEGSNSEKERLRSARETSQRSVSGFVLEGFDSSVCNWQNLLHKTVKVLPDDKPRVVHGIGTPEEVIIAVENGIDLFDSCYPYQATERGCALEIKWSRKRFKPDLSYTTGKREGHEAGGEIASALKQSNAIVKSCEKEDQGRLHEININLSRHMDDFSPLVAGCACHCCRNHTRAYVHHLLVTKEMLGQVLLMLHNFHEYFQFFRGIQSSIAENSFEEFKINFLTEYTHKDIVTT